MKKNCNIKGCKSKYYAKGHCQKHYDRFRKTGSTDGIYDLSDLQRFEERYQISDTDHPRLDSPCWNWISGKAKFGYGNFFIGGKRIAAHRWSYQHYIGDIPEDMLVRHRCDVPDCVNPNHLILGTHSDNMWDKVRRGRCNVPMGEDQHNSKLTDDQVINILKELKDCERGTMVKLAKNTTLQQVI